ncbi:hypothetical protein [Edaphobacter dinghuensis]|uniref:Uncharacterized protein n=1 Tax=Edaphobacter dinghuensis TaxID=1560005 RepID=A0A917H9G3_9BACT|nr:hypothetical protein [Edaphobacter dinghuensis]GGG71873.1 hypothetical protein GCM10011585_12680 [Edaphobacter dinghuensis]
MYDQLEVLAAYTEYPVAVMTDDQHAQIEMIALDDINPEVIAGFQARGLHFAAACGLLLGIPEIAMQYPLPEHVAFAVGAAHREYIAGIRTHAH